MPLPSPPRAAPPAPRPRTGVALAVATGLPLLALGGVLVSALAGPGLAAALAPEAFPPFGHLHAAVGAVSALLWTGLVLLARRARARGRETAVRRALGVVTVAFNLGWLALLLTPERFAWGHSLPLHLCDLAWMAAAWSLLRGGPPQHLRHQVPVLWGLALSVLAYLTPAVTAGPGGLPFWTFWITHWQILAAALLNLLVLGTRPTGRGLAATLLLTLAGGALATGVNLVLDTTYFFTGRGTPSNPTPLDLLGGWPLRILWIALLGAAALCLVALPFLVVARRQRRRALCSESHVPSQDRGRSFKR